MLGEAQPDQVGVQDCLQRVFLVITTQQDFLTNLNVFGDDFRLVFDLKFDTCVVVNFSAYGKRIVFVKLVD